MYHALIFASAHQSQPHSLEVPLLTYRIVSTGRKFIEFSIDRQKSRLDVYTHRGIYEQLSGVTKSLFHRYGELPLLTAGDYFWDMLPYAVPGLLTFIVGLYVAFICLQRYFATEKGSRNFMFLHAATMFIGFGVFGLIFALRAVVRDDGLLLAINNRLQWIGTFTMIGSTMFAQQLLPKKYRILTVLHVSGWLVLLLTLITGFMDLYFLNDWFDYPFGKYPRGSIFAKVWALVGVITTVTLTAILVKNFRSIYSRGEKLITVGLILLGLLLFLNAPSQVGIRFFPPAIFSFIPMCIVLTGILLSDFLDLNEYLFSKSGFFYAVTFFVGNIFLLSAYVVVTFLAPDFFSKIQLNFYMISAIISVVVICMLAITIAGNDPRSKVNQLAAIFLFSLGIFELIVVCSGANLPPSVYRRIEQIIYLIFTLAPALGLHTMYVVYGKRLPRHVYFVYAGCFICSALSLTPYFYSGYYIHSFGMYAAAGPGSTFFTIVAAFSIIDGLRVWFRERKTKKNQQANYIIFSFILLGVFILTAVPALEGFDVYHLAGLLFIPGGILAYGLTKHGPIVMRRSGYQLNRRLAQYQVLLLAVIFPLFLVAGGANKTDILRLLFVLVPLFLFGYILLFLFTKPMTMAMDAGFIALEEARKQSDELLLNILPKDVAEQLKTKGEVDPLFYDSVTILFTDFVGFTRSATMMLPDELIEQLNRIFFQFDAIAKRYNLEKIKTIGDSYMAAGGLPQPNLTHHLDVCLAALEIQKITDQIVQMSGDSSDASFWRLRIGIHTGSVMAGVVGQYKFVYDIFGDAVNVASRMESTGIAGQVNISADTYNLVKYFFDCEYRGKLSVKNRGEVEMYFLSGLKRRYVTPHGAPNEAFKAIYEKIRNGARIEPKPGRTAEEASSPFPDKLTEGFRG